MQRIAKIRVDGRQFVANFVKCQSGWVALSAHVPGALTQGRSIASATANLRDAIRLMLEPIEESPVRAHRT